MKKKTASRSSTVDILLGISYIAHPIAVTTTGGTMSVPPPGVSATCANICSKRLRRLVGRSQQARLEYCMTKQTCGIGGFPLACVFHNKMATANIRKRKKNKDPTSVPEERDVAGRKQERLAKYGYEYKLVGIITLGEFTITESFFDHHSSCTVRCAWMGWYR